MKRRFIYPGAIVLVLMAVASLPGCRSILAIPGQWVPASAADDGRPDDFSKKITSHLFENGMMVGIGNDNRNLYVLFSPDIRHRQQLPGRATLTLWLDDKGGKARKLGLVLISSPVPRRIPEDQGRPEMKRDDHSEHAASQQLPSGNHGQVLLKVVDRRVGREAFIATDGSRGPAVRLTSDWGDFSYQLAVPIEAAADGDWPGLRIQPGKPIGIGFLWKIEFQRGFSKKNAPGRFRGGPPPGSPGQGGEGEEMGPPGMKNGGPGRGMPGQDAPRKRTLWLKTFLATR
jgi:hypothetical protein